jgi:hypothetical protein
MTITTSTDATVFVDAQTAAFQGQSRRQHRQRQSMPLLVLNDKTDRHVL